MSDTNEKVQRVMNDPLYAKSVADELHALNQVLALEAGTRRTNMVDPNQKPWHETTAFKILAPAAGAAVGIGGTLLVTSLAKKGGEETANAFGATKAFKIFGK